MFGLLLLCGSVSAQNGNSSVIDTIQTTGGGVAVSTQESRAKTKIEAMSTVNVAGNSSGELTNAGASNKSNVSAENSKKKPTAVTEMSRTYFESLSASKRQKLLENGVIINEPVEIDLSSGGN